MINQEFKDKVFDEIINQRQNFGGTDSAYANSLGIKAAVYSRIKNGERDGLLSDSNIIHIGRTLNVSQRVDDWKVVETDVLRAIKDDVINCQKHSLSMMFVDEPEIGKTVAARYLSKTLKNCFYIDCSQAKTKNLFIKALAKAIGVDPVGKYSEILANVKYYLLLLRDPNPVILLDEFGDVDYLTFMTVKELWNAGEGHVAWYAIGADGLRCKIDRGMENGKVGFKEMFSRFSARYMSTVPVDKDLRNEFYTKLISDVITPNLNSPDKSKSVNKIIKKCLANDSKGRIGGIRRAKALLHLTA